MVRSRRRGHGVYPIIDDADPYGVGSSGPAVPTGSGLTAPGLAEVASWRSATRPASSFHKRSQLFIRTHNEPLSVVAVSVSNPDRSPLCQVTLGLRGFFRVCFSPGYDLALAPRASTIFEPSGAVQK